MSETLIGVECPICEDTSKATDRLDLALLFRHLSRHSAKDLALFLSIMLHAEANRR